MEPRSITYKNYEAWDYETNDRVTTWNISKNCYSIATAKVRVTRKRYDDLSGMKKFRIVTKTEIELSFRMTVSGERYEMKGNLVLRSGEITSIRELLRYLEEGNLHRSICLDMEYEARDKGIPEIRIIEALDPDQEVRMKNLYRLLSK